jgi:hypothetical protein
MTIIEQISAYERKENGGFKGGKQWKLWLIEMSQSSTLKPLLQSSSDLHTCISLATQDTRR